MGAMKTDDTEHARLLDFARASGDWMWELDGERRYLWIGGAFNAVTGLDGQALIGSVAPDAPLLDAAGVALPDGASMHALLRAGRPFSRALVEKKTPRGRLVISLSAVPVHGDGGAIVGWRGTARDVTELLRTAAAEREREVELHRLEEAERANQARIAFLSRISHELRTPLNAILGFTQLMAMDAEHGLAPEQRRRLEGAQHAARHLLRLVNDVLEATDGAGGPVPDSSPQALDTAPLLLPEGAPERRVLYVEDEPLNVVLMQEVFRGQPGWSLEVAADGAAGIAAAQARPPDLALIDMNLPDMTGLEVVRALREHPRTAALRCIALSADALRDQMEVARAAGFDDYWTKPIDVRRMLAALAKALQQS
jgi:CheY-like chemotaxis protein